jgi:hypothetical protein
MGCKDMINQWMKLIVEFLFTKKINPNYSSEKPCMIGLREKARESLRKLSKTHLCGVIKIQAT